MVNRSNNRRDEAVAAGSATVAEARLFHGIVEKLGGGGLPAGVQRVGFHFGEDTEGAPAVWITFVASDDLKPSKEKIADLQRVMREVKAEILRSDTERWPYVEIVTE